MTTPTGGVVPPTPQLQKFYLTFGVKYSHEPHPFWPGATPRGWVLIEAATEERARGLAYLYFKESWSMLYPENHFPVELNKQKYYPLGEIAAIRVGHRSIPVDGRTTIEGEPVAAPLFAMPNVGPSEPLYYGVLDAARVAVRIEGRLIETDAEPDEADVEYVHPDCYEQSVALFDTITEEDHYVKAFELDWSLPYECPVCGVSIT